MILTQLKRYYNDLHLYDLLGGIITAENHAFKPNFTHFLKEHNAILLQSPKAILNSPIDPSWNNFFLIHLFCDTVLCLDKALHYYFSFKAAMTLGYENPGELLLYYSQFFTTVGFLRLSGWALVHLDAVSIISVLNLPVIQPEDLKFDILPQPVKDAYNFLSGSFVLEYAWKSGYFILRSTRGNEHKDTFTAFEGRYRDFDFGNEPGFKFFGSNGDFPEGWEYMESTERNEVVYDLSNAFGEILNPVYGTTARLFAANDFLKQGIDRSNLSDENFKGLGYKEFFGAKYIEKLFYLLLEIALEFNDPRSKRTFKKLMLDRRMFLEEAIKQHKAIEEMKIVISQMEYFISIFNDIARKV